MPAGVVERLRRRRHPVENEVVDLAPLLGLHPLVGIEAAAGAVAARHLRRDLAGQIGDVAILDPARAALALEQAGPSALGAVAERRDHADAGDYNASHPFLRAPIAGTVTGTCVARRPGIQQVSGTVARRERLRVKPFAFRET